MDFDNFVIQLFEEAKSFFEKAKSSTEKESKEAYLHSSLLLVMSSLEACVNSIVEEILIDPYKDKYDLLEQSLLLEKEIVFENGHYKLGNKLKMSRIIERIEFLIFKFSGKEIPTTTEWFQQLKQRIDFRDKLVHPKEDIILTERQVENAMSSVLETINELYKAVYKKSFPAYSFGTTSRLTIS